jgi:hypothetical protein
MPMPSTQPRKPRQTWTLPPASVEKLRQLAAIHHRTPSGELSAALAAWIAQHASELEDAG